jgi:hypothetical protein
VSASGTIRRTPARRRVRGDWIGPAVRRGAYEGGGAASPPAFPVLDPWLRSQAINTIRHAAALRPFASTEFGMSPAAPSPGHLEATNRMLIALRTELLRLNRTVRVAAEVARRDPSAAKVRRVLVLKERAHGWVRAIERVWDFYFELFGQRQSRYGVWLLGCDRIALDCYQAAFRGVGAHKTIPAPPPFAYMRTGFSPATYRRGIPLSRLGRLPNPYALVELPLHRMTNPWTLGAVLHEVSHNLQNDLGLDRLLPREIERRLLAGGLPRQVAATWRRWNRETFADLSGLLLGGPTIVASLMDVVGRSPRATLNYSPRAPHPNPYLRALISVELLRRMGFAQQAERFDRAWRRLYPNPRAGNLPSALVDTFPAASRVVVDTVCFRPYRTLGGRTLASVYRFEPKDQQMIEEAAKRLAAGNDPGVIPARFMIGAARAALDRGFARPGVIARNFYAELARR